MKNTIEINSHKATGVHTVKMTMNKSFATTVLFEAMEHVFTEEWKSRNVVKLNSQTCVTFQTRNEMGIQRLKQAMLQAVEKDTVVRN